MLRSAGSLHSEDLSFVTKANCNPIRLRRGPLQLADLCTSAVRQYWVCVAQQGSDNGHLHSLLLAGGTRHVEEVEVARLLLGQADDAKPMTGHLEHYTGPLQGSKAHT